MSRETHDVDIRALRMALGMTQEQLARALGTTATTVSRWEREKTRPTGDLMRRALAKLARKAQR